MKFKISKASVLAFSLAASSVVLTGCLGGGGGGSGGGAAAAGPVIGGVAGKGLLKKAKVTAYCGKKSDGDLLGTDTTGDGTGGKANGAYSLTASKPCAKPVEIAVEFAAGATMLDETQGEVAMPATLALNALIPSATSNVTQNVTPFTHMAAEVAKQATTLDAATVTVATTAIVNNVLGGNAALMSAAPKPISDYNTATADEKQLLNLLTAVSAAAANAAATNVGTCATANDIACVITDMAAKAKATVPTVSSTGYTVAATATAATSPLDVISKGNTALTTDAVTVKNADQTVATTLTSTIKADTGTTTLVSSATTSLNTNATTGTVAVTNTSGIAAARQLFVALRDDVQGISNDSKTGFVDVKAKAMSDDMNSIAGTGIDLINIVDLVSEAETLTRAYSDAGSPTTETNNDTFGSYGEETVNVGATGAQVSNTRGYYSRSYYEGGKHKACKVYTKGLGNNGTTELKGSAHCYIRLQESNTITAGGSQYSGSNLNIWLKNTGGDYTSGKTYTYQNFITTFTTTYTNGNPTPVSVNDSATTTRHNGTFTASYAARSGGGYNRTGLTLGAGSKLVPFVTGATDTAATLTISGNAASGSLTGSLTSGALSVSLASGTGYTYDATAKKGTAKLVAQIKTGAFQYDGTMDIVVPDGVLVNGIVTQPKVSSASFTGKMSTLSNGAATEFLSGTFSASRADTGDTASLSGKVTNGTKLSQLTASGSTTIATNLATSSITYGFGTYSLTFSGTKNTATGVVSAATITSSDGIKLEKSGDLVLIKDSAGKKIGEVNKGTVNFTDGTYLLLTGASANIVAVSAGT